MIKMSLIKETKIIKKKNLIKTFAKESYIKTFDKHINTLYNELSTTEGNDFFGREQYEYYDRKGI